MSSKSTQQQSNDVRLSEEDLYDRVLSMADLVGPEPHRLTEEELTRLDALGKQLSSDALRLRAYKRGDSNE